jgi:hypothetical protein
MKSYTRKIDPSFEPVCKEYFSDYCVDHCNWFGTCWDFEEDLRRDTTRVRTGDGSDLGISKTV